MSMRSEKRDVLVRRSERLFSARVGSEDRDFTAGIFMRPHLGNKGKIPATTLCRCPDIWIAGTDPLPDPKKLADEGYYAQESLSDIYAGRANYVYVRAQNGSKEPQTAKMHLYQQRNAIVQWPQNWADGKIPADTIAPVHDPCFTSEIKSLQHGKVGVAENVFIWRSASPLPQDSDHYCLIVWVDDGHNLFPEQNSRITTSDLLTNNLQFGWRNVGAPKGVASTAALSTYLSVPDNLVQEGKFEYRVEVQQFGFPDNGKGWKLDLSASKTDADKKPIRIDKEMPEPGFIYSQTVMLERGWGATVTVNVRNETGTPFSSDQAASIDVSLVYPVTKSELPEAVALKVIDYPLSMSIYEADHTLGFQRYARLGSDRFQYKIESKEL